LPIQFSIKDIVTYAFMNIVL